MVEEYVELTVLLRVSLMFSLVSVNLVSGSAVRAEFIISGETPVGLIPEEERGAVNPQVINGMSLDPRYFRLLSA